MSKILLIAYKTINKIGGIEKYNKSLVELIEKNYNIDEIDIVIIGPHIEDESLDNIGRVHYYFPFKNKLFLESADLEQKNILFKFHYLFSMTKYARKFIYSLEKLKKYDIILDSTTIYFPKICSKHNYFLIQHHNLFAYLKQKNIHKSFYKRIVNLYEYIFLKKDNQLKKLSNFIVYDDRNASFIRSHTKAIIYEIPLFSELKSNNIDILSREKIVYFGRIDNIDKDINSIIKINFKIGHLIDFYGKAYGEENYKFLEELKESHSYFGEIIGNKEKSRILSKYKFIILYSKTEGFGFSLVEALSLGIPLIVKDTFLSASFLCNEKTGLLLETHTTVDEDIKKIKEFYNMPYEEYKKYSDNALLFFQNNLMYQKFEENWMNIFDKFLKRYSKQKI